MNLFYCVNLLFMKSSFLLGWVYMKLKYVCSVVSCCYVLFGIFVMSEFLLCMILLCDSGSMKCLENVYMSLNVIWLWW